MVVVRGDGGGGDVVTAETCDRVCLSSNSTGERTTICLAVCLNGDDWKGDRGNWRNPAGPRIDRLSNKD